MNIVVFLKAVADNTKVQANSLAGKDSLPTDGVPLMMNPFDEYALETALRLKDQAGDGSTVTLISLGTTASKEALKKALAAGADAAVLINDESLLSGDAVTTAHAFAKAVQTQCADAKILLFGQAALDGASAQTGPMVAEILGWPSLTSCKLAELAGDQLRVQRESERGTETYSMNLPAVISMMKCDYELRTSNIKGVMKANKTQIPEKTASDLGVEASAKTTMTALRERPAKAAGQKIDGADANAAVAQVMDYLKTEKLV